MDQTDQQPKFDVHTLRIFPKIKIKNLFFRNIFSSKPRPLVPVFFFALKSDLEIIIDINHYRNKLHRCVFNGPIPFFVLTFIH